MKWVWDIVHLKNLQKWTVIHFICSFNKDFKIEFFHLNFNLRQKKRLSKLEFNQKVYFDVARNLLLDWFQVLNKMIERKRTKMSFESYIVKYPLCRFFYFLVFSFRPPPGLLPVLGPLERYRLLHLTRPCLLALGRVLIWVERRLLNGLDPGQFN